MRLAELAKMLRISQTAVRNAISEGRISSFTKDAKGYKFDADRAIQEYIDNTNKRLSRNSLFDEHEEKDLEKSSKESQVSVLDIEPKYWTDQEALQAKTIYQALKVKHELEVQEGKFYPKPEADKEFVRISQTFARGVRSLPIKIKQRHPDITEAQLNDLKQLCKELIDDCESKL